jgi:hypothetical protein
MPKILTSNVSIDSAKLLRDQITKVCGTQFLVTTHPANINDGVLARYGNGMRIPDGQQDTKYNTTEFTKIAIQKNLFANLMLANKICAPKFYSGEKPTSYPVVIRETLDGYGGAGIKVAENEEQFMQLGGIDCTWTPYQEVDYEVRAYVIGGEMTGLYVKKPFANQVGDKYPIRSEWKYSVRYEFENVYSLLKRRLRQVTDIVQGKFFAADVGYSSKLKDYFFFEINSGAWMSEGNAERLAKYLVKELGL